MLFCSPRPFLKTLSLSSVFQSWTGPEKLLALDELIDSCEPTQVKHMMQVIEPQFQRDFISLLPKEVSSTLSVISSRPVLLMLSPLTWTLAVILHGGFYLWIKVWPRRGFLSSPFSLSPSSLTSLSSLCCRCLVFAPHHNRQYKQYEVPHWW